MRHSLETKLIDEVLAYLGSRPYTEVQTLIAKILQSAQPVEGSQVVESDVVSKDQAAS